MKLKLGLIVIAFLFSSFGPITTMVGTWIQYAAYSHGILIPLISGYLIWSNREELKRIPVYPNIVGGSIILIIGYLLLIIGRVGSVITLEYLSIIVILPGLVLMLLGTRHLISLSFPLAYLIFMIPSLEILLDRVHWPFQILTATASANILKILHYPVYQSSTFLTFPNITLEIAQECSGVHYLLSIIAIGIPLSILSFKKLRQRVILIALAVVIGVISNIVRVILIGMWTYKTGGTVDIIHGPLHILHGLLVSIIGYIFLFASVIFLGGSKGAGTGASKINDISEDNKLLIDTKRFNRSWQLTIIFIIAVSGYLYGYISKRVVLEKSISELPRIIGDWEVVGKDNYNRSLKTKGADEEAVLKYRNKTGREIDLYVSYYENQRQGKDLINGRLYQILKNSEKLEMKLKDKGNVYVNKKIIEDDAQKYALIYWYYLDNRIITNPFQAKLLTIYDGLVYGRTNATIVMIYSSVDRKNEVNRVFRDGVEFAGRIIPVLRNYFP